MTILNILRGLQLFQDDDTGNQGKIKNLLICGKYMDIFQTSQ